MKIARPKPPETEFKRKRGPPPQATKLLVSSLGAGLVFMGLLAIVFVPRYLENLNQPPVVVVDILANVARNTTGANETRYQIDRASLSLPLSTFNASLLRDNVTLASLPAGLVGGSLTFRFVDANANLVLDAGDYFLVGVTAPASYQIQLWQRDVGRLVGVYWWPGSLT